MGAVTFTSTYDGAGNLKTLADQSGTTTYNYNPVNLPTEVIEPSGATTSLGYDPAYRRNLVSYPNGVTQATVYDDDGKVTTMVGKKADGTVLTSFGYDYRDPDQANKPTELVFKLTEPAGVTSYKYDNLDRLTQATGPTGNFLYELDPNSNRTSQTINGVVTGYTVNAADQLTAAGSTTFTYDANGNLTGQSDGRVLTYNSKDQNTSFNPGGPLAPTSTMSYLGTGQFERTGADGTTFTNGPLGLASSTDAAVLSTTYVRDSGGGLLARKDLLGTQYYLFDRLGSVVALTDAQGNAVNTYVYDPYGNPLAGTTEAVANPWQFAGGFKDAFSGYYKFGTRYYDPTIGRWTQPDPSGLEANNYLYAAANPVNFVDPAGLCARCGWQDFVDTMKFAWEANKEFWPANASLNYSRCFYACATISTAGLSGGVANVGSGRGMAARGAGWAGYLTIGEGTPSTGAAFLACAGACLGGYKNSDGGWGAAVGAGSPGLFFGGNRKL